MKQELLPTNTEWRMCAKCGQIYGANQKLCDNCALPQSKPDFLAGLITTFIGLIALYFLFQL